MEILLKCVFFIIRQTAGDITTEILAKVPKKYEIYGRTLAPKLTKDSSSVDDLTAE